MSTTDTQETAPLAEATAGRQAAPDQAQADGQGPDHDHSHHPAHGPVLNPELTREVEFDAPAEEVSRQFRSVVRGYQKAARLPGFRVGKVPESVVRARYADSIRQDVLEALLPERFREAVEKAGLKPVSQPQVTELTVEDGRPLHCRAAFEVLPDFSIEGYGEVRVERPATELTDEEFEHEIAQLRDSRAVVEPVEEDREIVAGDWAQISFRGEFLSQAGSEAGSQPAPDAGPQAGQQSAEPASSPASEPIAGEDVLVEVDGANTVEAFNAALRGSRPGQELKFEVVYPAEFADKRLAGHTVAYDVTVKAIKKRIQPELNDELAKELGDYDSWQDFAARFRERLAGEKRRGLEEQTRDRLLSALIERFPFPVPESLVQQQVDARLERGLRALARQGMRTEDMRRLDFDRLRAAQREAAIREVRGSLLLEKIADTEGVEVTDAELDRELEMLALQALEPVDRLRARLTGDGSLARIREQLRREKTGSLLYERLAS